MKRFAVLIGAVLTGCFGYQVAYSEAIHFSPGQDVIPLIGPAPMEGSPERSPDGTYPLLLASMKSGQVTEITPANVVKWSAAQPQRVNGKNYWVVTVTYGTQTQFGIFQTEAAAYVIHGKVEKWIYTGSGEVVP